MSAWLDYTGGDGPGGSGGEDLYTGGDSYTGGVGYAGDGTYSAPAVAVTAQPVDAGGGPVGNYGQTVLDIFKFGVGVWNSNQQQQNLLEYKRWEATRLGAYQQGQPALTLGANGRIVGGASGVVLVGIALLAVVLLQKGK